MRKILSAIVLVALFSMPNIALTQTSNVRRSDRSNFAEELEKPIKEFESRAINEAESILSNLENNLLQKSTRIVVDQVASLALLQNSLSQSDLSSFSSGGTIPRSGGVNLPEEPREDIEVSQVEVWEFTESATEKIEQPTEITTTDILETESDNFLTARIVNQEIITQVAALNQAQTLIKQKDVKKVICPALPSATKDVFEITSNLIPVVIGAVLTGTITVPLTPVFIAALSVIIIKTGVQVICQGL